VLLRVWIDVEPKLFQSLSITTLVNGQNAVRLLMQKPSLNLRWRSPRVERIKVHLKILQQILQLSSVLLDERL
jgi:hypothetical protein